MVAFQHETLFLITENRNRLGGFSVHNQLGHIKKQD